MDVADIAYTAGIIDGEGHISCVYQKDGYRKRIAVHMKYEKVPKWLHEKWGGYFVKVPNGIIWRVGSGEGYKMMVEIMPYMVEKQRQAEIWLEMVELNHVTQKFKKDPPELAAKKKKLYLELKGLHN